MQLFGALVQYLLLRIQDLPPATAGAPENFCELAN
jgi:hypothetical protein